jgi:dTDP-4-dehydrorhamnose reductase
MNKIAVTGHEGRIGSLLVKRGYTPLECDIADEEQVRDTVLSVNPDVIIHCAAMTDVGWCEENKKEASKVHIRGTDNVLQSFKGSTFIYLSTVHVFNGRKYFDYTEKHEPSPVNEYGWTKWAGEIVANTFAERPIVLRISKAFDYEWMKSALDVIQNPYEISDSAVMVEFPTFIKRSFVYTPHLVEGIAWVAENLPDVKLLNVSGTDTLSYYDFWVWAAKMLGLDENRIIPRKHEIDEYPRPFRGGLNVKKAKKLGVPLYSVIDGLKAVKDEL